MDKNQSSNNNEGQTIITYTDDYKIQTGPSTCKISPETKSDPFQQHLNGKQNGENHVHYLQDQHQFFVILKVELEFWVDLINTGRTKIMITALILAWNKPVG